MQTDVDREIRFEAVVREVYEPLQRYFGRRAHRDDVSELLNDTLLVIWRRLDDVPLADVRPWSYGVAKHCLANHHRAGRRRLRLVGRVASHAQEVHHDRPRPDDDHPELTTALAELDDSERELIRLWSWEQLEPREIAIVLDTSANAISLRLARAKRKIAASIERQNRGRTGHEGDGHRKEVGS